MNISRFWHLRAIFRYISLDTINNVLTLALILCCYSNGSLKRSIYCVKIFEQLWNILLWRTWKLHIFACQEIQFIKKQTDLIGFISNICIASKALKWFLYILCNIFAMYLLYTKFPNWYVFTWFIKLIMKVLLLR